MPFQVKSKKERRKLEMLGGLGISCVSAAACSEVTRTNLDSHQTKNGQRRS